MSIFLTGYVITLSLLAWGAIFYVVPSVARSIFRYRLWRLRDEIVDSLADDRFEDRVQPERLMHDVEKTIRYAKEFSLWRLLLLRWLTKGRALPPEAQREMFDLKRAPIVDQELLATYELEYHASIARHVFFGTPLGWVCIAFLFPIAFAIVLMRDASGRVFADTRTFVREEVPLEPEEALLLLGVNGSAKPLSAFV
jgi:hypothetical protein